jgi:hypothetical protein
MPALARAGGAGAATVFYVALTLAVLALPLLGLFGIG